ncbi:unnamed protein product, partial [Symbiodinium sp. CCMP2456]
VVAAEAETGLAQVLPRDSRVGAEPHGFPWPAPGRSGPLLTFQPADAGRRE